MPSVKVVLANLSLLVASPVPVPHGIVGSALRQRLHAARTELLQWAPKVDGSASQPDCNTPNRGSCDLTFWNGMLCSNRIAANNMSFACDDLVRSQGPSGMLWRSPWEAAQGNSTNGDFFSRDQGLSTLLATTNWPQAGAWHNETIWRAWLSYIGRENAMCPHSYGLPGLPEWDCVLEPQFWCTFHKVATFAGISPPSEANMWPKLGASICHADHEFVLASATVNELGSALHLTGLDVLIRRRMGDWSSIMQAAADRLHTRQPVNPFFEFLAKGASDALAARLLSLAPANASATTCVPSGAGGRNMDCQWSWVREDKQEAWLASMGWDFVFLIDLMLADHTTPES